MNIPQKIRIGSVDYEVQLTKDNLVCQCKECYGFIDYDHHTIKINERLQDEQGQEQTFLHEMLHGIIRERNLTVENEELVVEEIALGLHQIIRDNQEIFKESWEVSMKKLITIQKRENLNEVYAVDEKGNGGANHVYEIRSNDGGYLNIQFQDGPRNVEGSKTGILDTDLLEVVRHRMQCFQAGPFATEYNSKALEHIELALMWMNRRVEDRIERNVLGTNNK